MWRLPGVRRIGSGRVVPRGEIERWRAGQSQLGDRETGDIGGKGVLVYGCPTNLSPPPRTTPVDIATCVHCRR